MTEEQIKELKVKWPKIVVHDDPVIEWMNLGNATMFRVISFLTFKSRNYPRYGIFVGIERKGCFLFPLDNPIMGDYVAEKLNLCGADADILADWINAQLNIKWDQQGHYNKSYILDNEPYRNIGEISQIPLVPEIIE